MKRNVTIIGLVALCALVLIALAAASASAATSGATAYTCVEGGTGGHGTKFKTSHCTEESSTGGFGHLAIKEDETTTLTTTAEESAVLGTKIFGAAVTVESTGVECIECSFHNHLVGEVHEVTGTGRLKFVGAAIPGAKCDIHEDLPNGVNTNTIVTQPLKFTTTNAKTLVFEPVVPGPLATFFIKEVNPVCNITGTFGLFGVLTGTLNGSTISFNIIKASGQLTVEGEPASFKGKLTLKGGKPETGVHHPIALTENPPF